MYLALKHFHITCVVLSGAGFALRGWWAITGSGLLRAKLTRRLPHIIDTCLLGSAITLAWMSGQYPFVQGWLTAKVLGLLAYIGREAGRIPGCADHLRLHRVGGAQQESVWFCGRHLVTGELPVAA